ncbi:MAG: hypothetical protein A4E72_01019 [Syntrophus sp. PtaU1.Bin208]|nr:MAG: hypothetical protein A4E72_01019 [Syntrophus sp. PtaU1.Bin208]
MQQTVLLDTNIHKGAKIHHVAHGAFEAHPDDKVFHRENIRAQDGRWGILTRIAPRARQLLKDIAQGGDAGAQFEKSGIVQV